MRKYRTCLNTLTMMILAAVLFIGGCASTQLGNTEPDAKPSGDSSLPPVSGFADDIQDIVIPVALEWDREKSMTIKTESFRGGVWFYTGKVEVISLKDFMTTSMKDNKWKLVGEATSKDVMLAFVKPGKTCMLVIADHNFGKTSMTLYVTIDKTSSAALNPFGEAVSQ